MSTTRPLLTPGEAADLLRLPTSRVKKLAHAGEIPAIQLPGDEIRFDAVDLADWVERRKRPTRQDSGKKVSDD